jgi:uncharacterized membrane protein
MRPSRQRGKPGERSLCARGLLHLRERLVDLGDVPLHELVELRGATHVSECEAKRLGKHHDANEAKRKNVAAEREVDAQTRARSRTSCTRPSSPPPGGACGSGRASPPPASARPPRARGERRPSACVRVSVRAGGQKTGGRTDLGMGILIVRASCLWGVTCGIFAA